MAISPDMIFSKWPVWIPRRASFFVSAVWVGSLIAGFSAVIATVFEAGVKNIPELLPMVIYSPFLLVSGWLCPNLMVMAGAMIRFSRLENLSYRSWGVFAGIESFFCLLGALGWSGHWKGLLILLPVWLVLTTMLATAVWFFHQWQMNHWAGELAMLRAENASRLARQEARRGKLPVPDEDHAAGHRE